MTIVDIPKANKSYRSINSYKHYNIKNVNVYLYMQVTQNNNKNLLCVKYVVLNNLLNQLPTTPLLIDEKYTKILNKASIIVNKNIKLNIIIVDKLVNPLLFEYKFNLTFIKLFDNFIKEFFNLNVLRYSICNVIHRLQYVNTKQIEEELLCDLFDDIKL